MEVIRRFALFHVLILVYLFFPAYSVMPASAQVTFTDDEAQFIADNPGLAYQDFLGTAVPPDDLFVCDTPANSASNGDCFMPGQILPGIEFSINPRVPALAELILVGSDFSGNNNPTNPLIANQFTSGFDIIFTAADINAVGMTAGCLLEDFPCTPRDMDVQVYGAGGLLGSTVVTVSDSFDTFIGINSDEPIVEILLVEDSPDPFQEGILNIRFNMDQDQAVASIPTLSEWGVVGAVAGLMLVGVFFVMRRRRGGCCSQ